MVTLFCKARNTNWTILEIFMFKGCLKKYTSTDTHNTSLGKEYVYIHYTESLFFFFLTIYRHIFTHFSIIFWILWTKLNKSWILCQREKYGESGEGMIEKQGSSFRYLMFIFCKNTSWHNLLILGLCFNREDVMAGDFYIKNPDSKMTNSMF